MQYDFEYSGVAEVRIVNRAEGGAQNFLVENRINGAEVSSAVRTSFVLQKTSIVAPSVYCIRGFIIDFISR